MTDGTPAQPTGPSESPHEQVSFATPRPPRTAPGRGRRAGRAATWMAVGAIGATALTGIAFAASDDENGSKSGPGTMAPSDGSGQRPGHGFGHHGGMFGGLKDVLHGEFVVKDGDGTKTMLGQRSEVTEASDTALTVKSSDGFTATWSRSSDTKVHGFGMKRVADADQAAQVEVGDDVLVIGTRTSATSGAATRVMITPTDEQLDQLRQNRPQRSAA